MDAWWQCEIPYPDVPKEITDAADSVRASLPNRYCDPQVAARHFEEVLDEFALCDEMGMNVVCIEHHAGINSMIGSNPMVTGALARQTKNVRVLSLGTLISLRPDPVRVAEEYATADTMLRGRFDIGFVKSGGTEMASANMQPVNNEERFWEAIDLVTKALTSHDGPVSWEGKHFSHRHINIWPGPYQRPTPPMWAATGDPRSAAEVGRRGYRHVLVLRGPEGTRAAYEAHRKARREAGLPRVTTDNFAYAALVYVGDTEEEGIEVGSKLLWFLNTSLKSAPQYNKFLPGAAPPQAAPGLYRTRPKADAGLALRDAEKGVTPASQNAAKLMGLTAKEAMDQGILFAGNPDSVHRQIMEFYDKVGGFGHLVLVGRSGPMTHAESKKGIRLFSQEVLPRLREVAPVEVG
ncbi:LLM class flavin-dependent oxidoreductase [Paracraurococcus lichenis]|uniref:LLM class flavin-dependent oxidoreductase n=1 Tax=Paracraurococcus lichenis TaxID=3064888 RepID=A0ABT9DTA5_9PROT|nr:LLM class flavin-dependent oxidoreductase [Paracraurococcus sp. LOR1-02]MDO9707132.1 LLM class flavin-dependent oxidoreductase [Paracraurococcus sp. LOR1-02]